MDHYNSNIPLSQLPPPWQTPSIQAQRPGTLQPQLNERTASPQTKMNPNEEILKDYIIDSIVDFSDQCTIYFCHKAFINYTIYRTFHPQNYTNEEAKKRGSIKNLLEDLSNSYDNRICLFPDQSTKAKISGRDCQKIYTIPGIASPITYTRFVGHIISLEYFSAKLDSSYFWMELPQIASFLYKLSINSNNSNCFIGMVYENFVVINNKKVRFLPIEFYNYSYEEYQRNFTHQNIQGIKIELWIYSLFLKIIAKLLNIIFIEEEKRQFLQNNAGYQTFLNPDLYYQSNKILHELRSLPNEAKIEWVGNRVQVFIQNAIQKDNSSYSLNFYLNKIASSFNQEVNLQMNVLQNNEFYLAPKADLSYEQSLENKVKY